MHKKVSIFLATFTAFLSFNCKLCYRLRWARLGTASTVAWAARDSFINHIFNFLLKLHQFHFLHSINIIKLVLCQVILNAYRRQIIFLFLEIKLFSISIYIPKIIIETLLIISVCCKSSLSALFFRFSLLDNNYFRSKICNINLVSK